MAYIKRDIEDKIIYVEGLKEGDAYIKLKCDSSGKVTTVKFHVYPEYDDIMWDIQTNSKNSASFNILGDYRKSGSNVWARCLIIDMNYYIKK